MNPTEQDKVDEILDAYGLHVYSFAPDYYSDGVSQLLSKEEARTQLDQAYLRRALEAVGEDYEPNFYRDSDSNLMCSTCNSEVFGGICDCYDDRHVTLNDVRTALTAAFTNDKGAK